MSRKPPLSSPFSASDILRYLEDEAATRMLGIDDTHLPPSPCCECGKVLSIASGTGSPKPGDLTLCVYCGCLNMLDDDLKLQTPPIDAMLEVAADREVQAIRRSIEKLKKMRDEAAKKRK
jgi:hypothetical protein